MQIIKKNEVEFISAESSVCLVFSSYGSISGNVNWCPSPACGSLFRATSNLQSVVVSFRLGWSSLFCPAGFLSAQGPLVVHLTSDSTASSTHTCLQRGFWCNWEGGIPDSHLEDALQPSGKMVGMFFCPCATRLDLSQIISNNEQFLMNQLSVSCEEPTHVNSCLVLMAALCKCGGWVGP